MMSKPNRKISVFGGTGFIGTNFCKQTSLDCILIPRESRSPQSDEILYFISTTDNYNVLTDIHRDVDVNIKILLDVLKNLKPHQSTLNFISSWFVYGDAPLPATEESICLPKGFYSITKLAAEQLLISYCKTFNIHYRIFRLCNVIGKGDQGASAKKNALQFLISELTQNREIKLYHGGEFYRDYLHVSDVARAIELGILNAPLNQIYNVGSGEKYLFRKLIDHAYHVTGSTSKISTMEPTPFHTQVQVKDFYMCTRKIENLGFKAQINIYHAIEELCH